MKEEVRNELNEAILDCLNVLQQLDPDSKEYADTCKNLAILSDCLKNGQDTDIRLIGLNKEVENAKVKQLQLEKDIETEKRKCVSTYVEGGVKVVGKLLSFVGVAMLTKSVLAYEDNGALRSRVWAWIPKLWTFKG